MKHSHLTPIFASIGKEYLIPILTTLDQAQVKDVDTAIRHIKDPIVIPGFFFKTTIPPADILDWWDRVVDQYYPQYKTVSYSIDTLKIMDELHLDYETLSQYINESDIKELIIYRLQDEELQFTDISTYPYEFQEYAVQYLLTRDGTLPHYIHRLLNDTLDVQPTIVLKVIAHYLIQRRVEGDISLIDEYLHHFDPDCTLGRDYPALYQGDTFISLGLPFYGDITFQQHTIIQALQNEQDYISEMPEAWIEHYLGYLELLLQHGNPAIRQQCLDLSHELESTYVDYPEWQATLTTPSFGNMSLHT